LLSEQTLVPEWCEWRFGLNPKVFRNYRFWTKAEKGDVWIASAASTPLDVGKLAAFGLLVMRRLPPRGKPTTIFLQRFGESANRNCIELGHGDLLTYMDRKAVSVTEDNVTRGSCIVKAQGRVIGCGRWEDGKLINQWPKYYTTDLPNNRPVIYPPETL